LDPFRFITPSRRRYASATATLPLAAATFAGGKALSTEVSTADVLKVAAAFERWLLEAL
jgi:hypothetical protein